MLSPAYSPAHPASGQRQTAVIRGVYMMMGRALERLGSVPAGCVLALGGLDTAILKSATLSSSPAVRPLAPMTFQAAPIVRVAVEPVAPADLPRLVEGLRLLNRADPFVEVSVLDSGEHVLGAAGEVHLETCVKDLRERFARVELQVSPPLVAFRESVGHPGEVGEGAAVGSRGPPRVVEAVTANGVATVRVRALPLPGPLASCLDTYAPTIKRLMHANASNAAAATPTATATAAGGEGALGSVSADTVEGESALRAQVAALVAEGGPALRSLLERGWLLGPKGCGPNLLLTRNTASAAAAAAPQGSSTGSAAGTPPPKAPSLFDAPPALVVKAHKAGFQGLVAHQHLQQHPHQEAGASSGAAGNGEEAGEGGDTLVYGQDTVEVVLGAPLAAQMLHIVPANGGGAGAAGSSGCGPYLPPPPGLEGVVATLASGVESGFQLATAAGPLCEEPVWGVAYEVEVHVAAPGGAVPEGGLELQEDVYGPFSGQVGWFLGGKRVRGGGQRGGRTVGGHVAIAASRCWPELWCRIVGVTSCIHSAAAVRAWRVSFPPISPCGGVVTHDAGLRMCGAGDDGGGGCVPACGGRG